MQSQRSKLWTPRLGGRVLLQRGLGHPGGGHRAAHCVPSRGRVRPLGLGAGSIRGESPDRTRRCSRRPPPCWFLGVHNSVRRRPLLSWVVRPTVPGAGVLRPLDATVTLRRRRAGSGKSGEIRCQFIILARKDEPTPDYARIVHRFRTEDTVSEFNFQCLHAERQELLEKNIRSVT